MVIAFLSTFLLFVIGAILIIGEAAKIIPVAIAVAMLLVCGLQDCRHKEISAWFAPAFSLAAAAFMLYTYGVKLTLRQLAIAAGALVILFIVYKLTKKGIGLGDIEVLTAMVFILGHLIAFLILGLASIAFIIYFVATKNKDRKKETPFIPFLYFASLPVLLLV